MEPSFRSGAEGEVGLQVLLEDNERIFCRRWRPGGDGDRSSTLVILPAAEHPSPSFLERLAHEYGLNDELDGAWAVRPLELAREGARTILVLEDPGGEPLERLLGAPMEMGHFLRLAISTVAALGKAHQCGLVHKDMRPANIIFNRASGEVRLTGFGIASRLPRERQAPAPPETIAGTLAYMAPEQTGRMNRSIDSRSDLYALGGTFYRMLTGSLPFAASDPMEWVHCHVARRPIPLAKKLKDVPSAVSAIIMKLLAKTAEERYQTAGGVERDLRRCLTEWEAGGHIDDFALGQQDMPDRLLIPEKLYGRSREAETLLASFERIVTSGPPELVLVSGYSGIGKSSVINELHRALLPLRGQFAEGKFDQYKRDIPYSTLAQALQSLVRPLLGKSDIELRGWSDAVLDALGPNARLMADLIPELTLIIGEQPSVPELPPQDAERRFQLVFRRFIGIFARPEHPLAIFLDDLQWLDVATLDLLEDLLTRSDLQHFMLIGAYRDNEVTADHPLRRKLDAIKGAGGKLAEITLAPLAREHLGQLIADTLCCDLIRAAPLAQLVHAKTGGNPFFAIQFLSSLAEQKLLSFDHAAARWSWDLERIHGEGYTDNVVDLMVGKLARLPTETQKALQQLACLGNIASIRTLSFVLGSSEQQIHVALWPAVRQELVESSAGIFRFVHDRIQEAAYSLVLESERPAEHLRIGRLFTSRTPSREIEENIFEVVSQFNRGSELITLPDERERLAELNLIAGRRAKQSSAYAAALKFFALGRAQLAQDCWDRNYKLIFALELLRAECEFFTGDHINAEQHLAQLSACAVELADQSAVACLRIDLLMTLGHSDQSVEVGLDYLRSVGVAWSPHPARDEVRQEFERIWQQIGSRPIHALIDLPLTEDPRWQAQMNVLTALLPPTLFTDENLFSLVVARLANVSIEHGNTHGSCVAYVWLGLLLGPHFDNYPAAFEFGQLGLDLVEKRGLTRFRARVYLDFSHVVNPWRQHARSGPDLVLRALEVANEIGDLTFAAYSSCNLVSALLAAGAPLADVQREAERRLEFARQLQFGLIADIITGQLRLIMALRGLTLNLASLDGPEFAELAFERRLERDPGLTVAIGWYWPRKLQGRVFACDAAGAMEAAVRVEPFLWTITSHLEIADYHFYAALARSMSYECAPAQDQPGQLHALRRHHAQLAVWADNCPDNFAGRAALVGAEIARIEGREFEAQRLYEQSIRCAQDGALVHDEALANEFAGRFYLSHGFEKTAHVYLRDARHAYSRWGAVAKVRQLDDSYPQIHQSETLPGSMSTIGAPIEHLDLATVIKVSQAVSGEIVLEKLIDTLMRTAVEQAGAERGLLILSRGAEQRVAAEASTSGNAIDVHLRDVAVAEATLPETVLRYVLRTREDVILDDARAVSPFVEDQYIRQRHARSVLCLPLLNRAKLIGVLYLENNLAPRVFAPGRITLLKLLASQAAISLENTSLYRDLANREAKIRRLVDANIVGIMIWNFEGEILEANEEFLRIVGYDRADLTAGLLRWTDLTPREWLDRDEQQWVPQLKRSGTAQPFEKEYLKKDGSRVSVLVGAATFEDEGEQGVAFVLDLSDRKRAAEALRETQSELAHANRVAAMGQLTASIAHELRQPLSAVKISGNTALRWLTRDPADIDEARQSIENAVKDATRANDVIGRIHDLVRKVAPSKDTLDINEALLEVVALTRAEAGKHGITAQMQLADNLPRINGDRVQLQQVMINLIMNAIQALSAVDEGARELHINSSYDRSEGVHVAVRDSGPGSTSRSWSTCLSPSTRPSPAVWAWGCRSVGPLSRITEGDCGLTKTNQRAPYFSLRFLSADTLRRWRCVRPQVGKVCRKCNFQKQHVMSGSIVRSTRRYTGWSGGSTWLEHAKQRLLCRKSTSALSLYVGIATRYSASKGSRISIRTECTFHHGG